MNITFPVGELFDRYIIAHIKFEKTQENQIEVDFYSQQALKFDLSLVKHELNQLKCLHLEMWELEKELKSGNEMSLTLEEIGRRAIAVRDKNRERIRVKNIIAEKLGCPVIEFKRDHQSE